MIRKVLLLLNPWARRKLWILIALLTFNAMLEALGIASLLPFMTLVINPSAIHENRILSQLYQRFGFGSDVEFLTAAGVVVLVLLVLSNCSKALVTWLTLRFQNRRSFELRRRLLEGFMKRPYKFYLGRNTSELAGTIFYEAGSAIDGVLRPIIDLVAGGTVGLAIFALLIFIDPLVALVIGGVLGGCYSVIFVSVKRKLDGYGAIQVESNAQKLRTASEALSAIKELKLLGREATFLGRFSYHAERLTRISAAAGAIAALPRYALEIISFGGVLLLVLLFINQGNEAANVVPILAMYAFAGYRLLPTMQMLFGSFVVMRFNTRSLDVVHRALVPDTTDEPELPFDQRAGIPPARFEQSVELRNVVFQYDTAAEPSLRGLNLVIRPNTKVGFVGPTGCGKTTTVDLILGLLKPTGGSLVLDGEPMSPAVCAGWQKIVGYVPQHIYISDDTIARNIAFGVPDAEIDMRAVKQAAISANLDAFIASDLPQGYETSIGEHGVRLSGGQRQRIGIARALYNAPKVLVLDEATSALDGVTEESVMSAVRNFSGGRTVVMIAHRLSTVRECDVIYQLDRGCVVASGTYDELMMSSQWFRDAARGKETLSAVG